MTAMTRILPTHWKTIVTQICEGKCVPFLGAAVNVSAGGYEGLPLGRDVALRFIEELSGLEPFDPAAYDSSRLVNELIEVLNGLPSSDTGGAALVAPIRSRLDQLAEIQESFPAYYADLIQLRMLDLARVALHVRVANDVRGLRERLERLLRDDHRQPSPLLQTIAKLPIKLIITTNYDGLMERALGERPHRVVTQPMSGFRDDSSWTELEEELADTEDLIVYKVHGSFKDANRDARRPPELIITEEDYIQFLTVVGREIGGIPTRIKSLIQDGTLLFLGYGLEDWDIRTIFKGLVESLEPSSQRRAFAIQKDPPDFWVDFWAEKHVTIYSLDLYEFAGQLEAEYRRRSDGRGPS